MNQKFKAWCKEHGWSHPFELGESILEFPDDGFTYPLGLCLDFCDVVQYTGFKDNNFEEVYNHDWLKVHYHNKHDTDVIEFVLGYVYWDNNEYAWLIKIPETDGYAGTSEKLSEYRNLSDYIEKVGITTHEKSEFKKEDLE